jgi:hypothetical protein
MIQRTRVFHIDRLDLITSDDPIADLGPSRPGYAGRLLEHFIDCRQGFGLRDRFAEEQGNPEACQKFGDVGWVRL